MGSKNKCVGVELYKNSKVDINSNAKPQSNINVDQRANNARKREKKTVDLLTLNGFVMKKKTCVLSNRRKFCHKKTMLKNENIHNKVFKRNKNK